MPPLTTSIGLLFGIVVWGFFSEATNVGLSSLVARADLLRKIRFPRYVIVLSAATQALISFGLSMVVMVLFLVIGRVPVRADIVWLPLLFLELIVFSLSLAFFLGAMFVRFRDMSYIWEVALQAGFYATPIILPLNQLPAKYAPYARLLLINPMAQIIQDARYVLITDKTLTMTQYYGTPWARAIPVGITVAMALSSVAFFRWRSPTFAEEI